MNSNIGEHPGADGRQERKGDPRTACTGARGARQFLQEGIVGKQPQQRLRNQDRVASRQQQAALAAGYQLARTAGIVRDDGKKQWALKGKPLYYWAKDQKPGDKTGDGFNNVWRVAKP